MTLLSFVRMTVCPKTGAIVYVHVQTPQNRHACVFQHLLPLDTFIPVCSSRAAMGVMTGCGYETGTHTHKERKRERDNSSLIPRNTSTQKHNLH